VKVILFTGPAPGIIIGRKGQEVERLQEELQGLVGRRINIKIEEIARPEIQAQLVAEDIAEQLSKRASFPPHDEAGRSSRVWKQAPRELRFNWQDDWLGPKWPGREKQIAGSIPLSTLRAKIDYGFTEAATPQGNIGVQVWINQGMYNEEEIHGR